MSLNGLAVTRGQMKRRTWLSRCGVEVEDERMKDGKWRSGFNHGCVGMKRVGKRDEERKERSVVNER